MARVTVEDCTKIIPNRFELVVLASRRAKDISSGAEIQVERDNDKDAVIALREVADGQVAKDYLLEEVVTSYQHNTKYVAEQSDNIDNDNVTKEVSAEDDAKNSDAMFAGDNLVIED